MDISSLVRAVHAGLPYCSDGPQDHGLFQAICRVNRLDTEDKEYGYIVDYKDLFRPLEDAINDYMTEAFAHYEKSDVEGLLKNRLVEARRRLDEALEIVNALCEPVHPKDSIHFIRYFCGNTENKDDLKAYEPGMRQLIDMYISAEASRKISAFDDMTLIQLIVERGAAAVDALPEGIRRNQEAVAETIENNNRKVIIEESPTNPKYYERMSNLLDALIQERKREAIAYEEYLKRVVDLTRLIKLPQVSREYSAGLNTPAKRALYDNLDQIIRSTKKDGWRGNILKEREVKYAIRKRLPENCDIDAIFDIIKNQDEY